MRLNETKMQILMGEQEMNIRMLAERSGVSKLFAGGGLQVGRSSGRNSRNHFKAVGGFEWRKPDTM